MAKSGHLVVLHSIDADKLHLRAPHGCPADHFRQGTQRLATAKVSGCA